MDILITGAGRGLGKELARGFLKKGARVHGIVHNSTPEDLKAEFPKTFFTYKVDITKEEQLKEVAQEMAHTTSTLDILINDAAVHFENHRPDLENIDFSVYLPTFQVNSIAPLMVIRTFLCFLRNGKTRWIANISSEAGSISNA